VSRTLFALIAALILVSSARAETLEKSGTFNGLKVDYKVVLPGNYDATRAYPAILAFGGGPMNMRVADGVLDRIWRAESEKRGYIVIAPAAPDGKLFYEGGLRVFPQFLDAMLAEYKVQGGKFHVAGSSNGGLSAFELAYRWPRYFWSVSGIPGMLNEPTPEHIAPLKDLCIYMLVGEFDQVGVPEMRKQVEAFWARGFKADYQVAPGQGHGLSFDAGAISHLFDQFDACRAGL
jgi:pimeloyl-ACP methyl ester carboxylesterase